MQIAGKLCVSVIEARNLQADDFAEKNFYVMLRVANNEVKTDVIKGSVQPKFLKDCRLAVPAPETDVLRIELLQVGPRGDLVVGSDELRLLALTSRGTIVHWFQLRTASRTISAELCLVLRYLSAGAGRPMSPTYTIAARQAKERALEGSGAPQSPSTSAFLDLPSTNGRYTPSTAAATAATGSQAASEQQGSSSSTPTVPAAAAAPTSLTNGQYGKGGDSQGPVASTATPRSGPGSVSGSGSQRRGGGAARESRRPSGSAVGQVPLPLAVLGGMVVGALVYIWRKRPVYYEVQEDDTLCYIASCFKKRVEDVYSRNRSLLKNPNRLYPGDRLRIR